MNKKKLVSLCLVLALLVTAAVGATFAYFTDTEQANNTMTVGNVEINIDEFQKVDGQWQEFNDGDFTLYPVDWNKGVQNRNKIVYTANVSSSEDDAYIRTIVLFEKNDVLPRDYEGQDDCCVPGLHFNYFEDAEATSVANGKTIHGAKTTKLEDAVTVNGKLSLVTDMPGTGRDANNDIKHMVDAGNVNNELGIITLKDGMNTIRIGRRSGGTEGAMPFTHLTLTKVSERPVIEAAEVKLYDDDWKEVTTITNDVDVTAFAKVPDSFSGKEVTMVFAVYKGNRLYRTGVKNELALKDTKLSIRLTGLEECEEGYSVKVMFLESLGSLAPLS